MLIKCPECGKEISSRSKACINCGFPLDELKSDKLYKITLLSTDPKELIESLKLVQQYTNLELREVRDIVHNLPYELLKGLSFEECQDAQKRFEYIGGKIQIDEDNESSDKNTTLEKMTFEPLKDKNKILCPKCHSSAISTGQRGFSLLTGFIGAGSTVNRCANCGYKWKP